MKYLLNKLRSLNKKIFIALLVVSYVFIAAGAVNAGFSGYHMAIPFMVIAVVLSLMIGTMRLVLLSVVFSVLAVVVNVTQTKNPILYPILSNGYVEILKDGYQQTFFDGSGGFVFEKWPCDGDCTLTKLKKGERYRVVGVRVRWPDFGQEVSVVTEIGEFSEYDYNSPGPAIALNKPARAAWADQLSFLMYWPLLFPW